MSVENKDVGKDLISEKLTRFQRYSYSFILKLVALENKIKGKKDKVLEILEEDRNDPNVEIIDNYFRIHKINDKTYAIGEQNEEQNHCYFICGETKAILYDVGVHPRVKEIAKKMAEDRGLELEIIFSHLHFDHTGNSEVIEGGLADLTHLRERAEEDDIIKGENIPELEYLGKSEGYSAPDIDVSKWIEIGEDIDLGGRKLKMLYAPGHCWNHTVLWDKENNEIFAADLMGTLPIYAMLPTSNIEDYIWTIDNLLKISNSETKFYNTHRHGHAGLPTQNREDLLALRALLIKVKNREKSDDKAFMFFETHNSTKEGVSLVTRPNWLKSENDEKRTFPDIPSGIPDDFEF